MSSRELRLIRFSIQRFWCSPKKRAEWSLSKWQQDDVKCFDTKMEQWYGKEILPFVVIERYQYDVTMK